MASQNIARLGVVLGLDTAEFTASIDKAISENAKLKNAIRRDTNSAAGELKALVHATEDYGKALTKVELIQREVTSGKFMNATADMKSRLLQQAAAYDKVAMSAKNAAGATFKMNEQQKINLTYQTTDFFTQIASGQSPFIAAIQQGGQLKDAMGGVGNMFRAIGSLFTPFSVGLGSVAIGLGAVGLAAYQSSEDLAKFKDALTLSGNYSGMTQESFVKLANTLSGQTKSSIADAKEALLGLISSGQFTEQSIGAVSKAIVTYAEIAGVSATEATQKLKGGLSGTAEGAKALNKEMNFLTLEQYKQIEALEKAGKRQEAAQLVAVALNTKLEQQRRELGLLEGAWNSLTKATSNYWDTFKSLLAGPTQSETMASLDKQIESIKQKLAGKENEDNVFVRGYRKVLESLQASKENLLEIQRLQNRSTSSKDVGTAKEQIDEYDKYKGMLRGKVFEVEKSKAEVAFAVAKQGANEIDALQIEAAKKLADAQLEMRQKNQQEDGRATQQNLEIYKNKAVAIATETSEKIKQIQIKKYMEEQEAKVAFQKEMDDEFVRHSQARISADVNAYNQTEELEFQRKSLELKYELIYATETEQKLAKISLEYARKRQELENSQNASDYQRQQLDRQEAMAKMFVTMEESGKRTQQVFDTVFGSMSSAIDNFVKTGKLSMKDLARSIIQDLIAIQMRAATLTFLRGMFGSFGGTGSSYNASGSMAEHVFNPSSYTGRAAGGSVTNNTPYVVGERGPEVFVPSGSGTIIPNNQMGSMGGTTNVTNNYINAIDVKSFETKLLESSNTIWAGYQYANKQLASNGRRA
jgi:lambda family phage tail tape measure protein